MKNLFFLFLLIFNAYCAASCQRQPSVYFYSDFGGGNNTKSQCVYDTQTAQELVSAAWKKFSVPHIYINDSAKPLSPKTASLELAVKFPYDPTRATQNPTIHKAVVHVVDPGVENDNDSADHHPRSAVLRKDGVLFVGPDNGSLSFVCPKGSIAGIWQIDEKKLEKITGNDTSAGGTFHGRDVFLDYTLLVITGKITLGDYARPYETNELKYRYDPISFDQLQTHYWSANWSLPANDNVLFEQAFLLGIMQSPWYDEHTTLTKFKVFWVNAQNCQECIAIVNKKTANIYVGPNNGWGTAFFVGYDPEHFTVHTIDKKRFANVWKTQDSDALLRFIQSAPLSCVTLKKVDIKGEEADISYGPNKRYADIKARVWIDAYGNIKTTLRSDVFQKLCPDMKVVTQIKVNGVERSLIQETSFARVPEGHVFIYPGSSAIIGDNPHRSVRYMEVSSNGVYGRFGDDFFTQKNGQRLKSGQLARIRIPLNT